MFSVYFSVATETVYGRRFTVVPFFFHRVVDRAGVVADVSAIVSFLAAAVVVVVIVVARPDVVAAVTRLVASGVASGRAVTAGAVQCDRAVVVAGQTPAGIPYTFVSGDCPDAHTFHVVMIVRSARRVNFQSRVHSTVRPERQISQFRSAGRAGRRDHQVDVVAFAGVIEEVFHRVATGAVADYFTIVRTLATAFENRVDSGLRAAGTRSARVGRSVVSYEILRGGSIDIFRCAPVVVHISRAGSAMVASRTAVNENRIIRSAQAGGRGNHRGGRDQE